MSTKRFGAQLVTPNVATIVMTATPQTNNVVVINIANLENVSTTINIAYMPGTTLSNISPSDYLVYQYMLNGHSFFQMKGIAVEEGYSIVVQSTAADVSAIIYGVQN